MRSRAYQSLILVCLLAFSALAQSPAVPAPPDTPKKPVSDEYRGVKVTDKLAVDYKAALAK